MSSFLFLHFCDDALWFLGLYFSAFHPFRTFLRWLFSAAVQTSTAGSHRFNRAGLLLRWCRFSTPPSDQPKIAAQGRVWFLPRTNLPLPLKGERLDFAQLGGLRVRNAEKPGAFPKEKTDTSYPRASLGSCLWQLMLTTAPTASTGPVWGFPGVVSLPCPQNRTQGRTGASLVLARWLALLRRITSLSAIPYKNSGRRKNTSAPLF